MQVRAKSLRTPNYIDGINPRHAAPAPEFPSALLTPILPRLRSPTLPALRSLLPRGPFCPGLANPRSFTSALSTFVSISALFARGGDTFDGPTWLASIFITPTHLSHPTAISVQDIQGGSPPRASFQDRLVSRRGVQITSFALPSRPVRYRNRAAKPLSR